MNVPDKPAPLPLQCEIAVGQITQAVVAVEDSNFSTVFIDIEVSTANTIIILY